MPSRKERKEKEGRGKMSVRPSVCRSVCLSHAGILSRRLNIS